MKIQCLYDQLVPVGELKPHPKNRNKHPKDQIDRLARILEFQGWRYPVKVSKRSGFVTSGHGRLEAARANGWATVPVNFQDYESDEQEYADLQADNAIALWAELDFSGINTDIGDIGPDFDIDLLGIKGFVIEPAELPNLPDGDRLPIQQMTFTLHDDQVETIKRAMEMAKAMGPFGDTGNENSNGNALARACETFITRNGEHGDS